MTISLNVLAPFLGLLTASTAEPATPEPRTDDLAAVAERAYVYGYPLVTMELTRRVMTNVPAPEGKLAPMGQFAHLRSYPSPDDEEVTAPNADTLYSLAWLDLSKGAYVLSLPDADGRYFLMPMLSGWTDVFQVPGKRTTGTAAQAFALTGPGWSGTLPEGVTHYPSPTSLVWILGRTYCDGTPEEYRRVHAFQDRFDLRPLEAYGKPYEPPPGAVDPSVDMKTPIREQVNRIDGAAYFALLADLLTTNPPAEADAPMVAELARIGVVPGQAFDAAKLDVAAAQAIAAAPAAGVRAITAQAETTGTPIHGWHFSTRTGLYGTDYLNRAFVTAIGLGANRPQDAIYPYTTVDGEGRTLSGANRYKIHFDKGQTPPVDGFWSVTMYDPDYFFVPNPIDRYSISARNALKPNDDGSVDLYVQHESPGDGKESNWLPAPAGDFILMLRMYWPREAVIDGTWQPPAVTRE